MIEHLRNPRLGHVRAHRRGYRPPWVQGEKVTQQRRIQGGARHERVTQAANRPPEEEAIRDTMQLGRLLHEPPVARAGPRGKNIEVVAHLADVGPQVEGRTVGEERAPLRVESNERHVVVEFAAGLGEDPRQDRRQSEDCRAHVEAEAVGFEDRGLAPEPVVGLEKHNIVTARRQDARRRQTAQTSANDSDPAGGGCCSSSSRLLPRVST